MRTAHITLAGGNPNFGERAIFVPSATTGFIRVTGRAQIATSKPIEAHAMVSACLEAYRATSSPVWYEQAPARLRWFLG